MNTAQHTQQKPRYHNEETDHTSTAPELLELLYEVLPIVETEEGELYKDKKYPTKLGKRIRKTIAKAEGMNTKPNMARHAQLIAAAPELLEALKSLLRHSEKTNYAFYVEGKRSALQEAFQGQKELLKQAREAIAKAEGRNE